MKFNALRQRFTSHAFRLMGKKHGHFRLVDQDAAGAAEYVLAQFRASVSARDNQVRAQIIGAGQDCVANIHAASWVLLNGDVAAVVAEPFGHV